MDLQTALLQACTQTRKHIRLLSGTYNLSAKMVVGCDDIIIDGDWEVVAGIGRKNSNLVTTINVNANLETAAYDGAVGATVGYYIGVEAIGRSNLRIEDISFNVKNGGAAGTATGTTGNRGNSVYGFYFRNCPNYFLERCVMNAGAASQGTLGVAGANGANGAAGTNGTDGACNDDCSVNNSGRGGNGGGVGGGTGGATVVDASCGSTSALGDNGLAGAAAGNARAGGGGGSGGTGGSENNRGGAGANGGNGGGGAGAILGGAASASGNNGTGAGNCTNINSQSAGAAGGVGGLGTSGIASPISSTYSFFWLPSGQSNNGTDGTGGGGGKGGGGGGGQGCFFCTDGTGSAGGGGGGGGQGGAAGTGGWGSGGSFALYSFNSTGQRGTSTINAAAATAGIAGGTGGTGGAGGTRGFAGGEQGGFFGCSTCEVGLGSDGGNGGNGGNAGAGGNGAAGVSSTIELQSGGSSTVAASSAITQIFTNQPLQGCTNSEIIISKDAGTWNAATPFITDLNIGSSSFNTASNTATISFTTTGWKDLVGSSGTYRNFVYIGNNRPAPIFAASTPIVVCEGDAFPLSSPTAGAQYEWIIFPAAGSTAAPTAVFTTSVAAWNTPVTGVSANYRARLRIRDNCCGWSSPVYFSFSVVGSSVPPTASGTTICEGQTATLVATGSGSNNINWYSDALGQILLQSTAGASSTFTTPSLNQNTVFFVGEGSASCLGALRSVAVIVNPRPVAPIANPVTVCVGTPVVFASSNNGGTVRWFNVATGGAALATGTTYNAGLLAAGTYTFYVEEFDGACASARVPVFATVNPSAVPPTASGATICAGNTANLSAVGVGIRWYADAGLTNQLASGNNFTTPVLNANTTFFVTSTSALGCQSTGTAVVVTVNPLPATPVVTNATICAGNTAALSASNAGGTTNWFSDATAANQIATGTSFTTPVLTQSATYFVRETSTAGCFSAIAAATANVNPLPATPTASAANVCQGGDVVINASGIGTGDLVFYNASLVEIARVLLPTGSHTVTGLANGNYTFYVRADNGTCLSGAVAVAASVFAAPAAPVASSVTICQGNTATFTATGTNVRWYSDAALTNQVGNGNSFTSTALAATTSYFVTNTSTNNCQSLATTVTATVNNNPAAPTTTGASTCQGGSATLTAVGTGGTLNWYSDASAINQVATGGSFAITAATQSTIYFVRETSASGCNSQVSSVTLNVTGLPNAPSTLAISVCQGTAVTLSATGSGTGDIVFYNTSNVEIGRGTMSNANRTITFSVGVLAVGNYVYTATEAVGTCASTPSAIQVEVRTLPAAPTASNDGPACVGEDIALQASTIFGGIYNWSGPNGFSQTGQTVFINGVTAAMAGTYQVNVILSGCTSTNASTTVVVNAAPVLTGSITNNSPLCANETLVLSVPTAAGVTLGWTGPNGFTASGNTVTVATVTENDNQGFYTVVGVNAAGCRSNPLSTLVNVNAVPPATFALSNSPLCEGGTLELMVPAIFGATYTWSGPDTFSSTDRQPLIDDATAAASGIYEVVINLGGCTSTLTTQVSVLSSPNATIINDTTITEDVPLQLYATGGVLYEWRGALQYLSDANSPTPIFSGAPAGVYTYFVNVTTVNGCVTQKKVDIIVLPSTRPVFVDLFTPNGDGINDTWEIGYLANLTPYTLVVYSRGGFEVYRSDNYTNNWDGTRDGNALPDGTYWYILTLGNGVEYRGAVTIRR